MYAIVKQTKIHQWECMQLSNKQKSTNENIATFKQIKNNQWQGM